MLQAYILLGVLALTLTLFVWGYWRYDIVALLALIALVVLKLVPANDAFSGFSSPAVITVACVMIITVSITDSGIIELMVKKFSPYTGNIIIHLAGLTGITAILSAFMNNIGALALMMPVAIQTANENDRSPSLVLMPLAFGSVLGGMSTAIGTPPNLLISAYRQQLTGHAFAMFDFSYVGIGVAISALLFIILFGWRLLPIRIKPNKKSDDMYQIQDYISEIRIPEGSPVVEKTRRELEQLIEGDFSILGLIRGKRKRLVIPYNEVLQAKDVLIIEATHDDLEKLVHAGKLEIVGGVTVSKDNLQSTNITIQEAVIPPGSRVEGRSWTSMRIRSRFSLNLLAIARAGKAFKDRLNHVNLRGGDVVLIQGDADNIFENIVNLGLVPLAERGVQVGTRRRVILPLLIFFSAILLAALRIFPVEIAFTIAVLALVLTNTLPIRKLYGSVDWSIIVLLGAMIPIGDALQSSGGTKLIAETIVNIAGHASPTIVLALLLIVTMTLSDIMNNAATAVVMERIAASIATSLGVSIDPFLMAVAIGASCSFLTPISHQNNTLVMGPGGYKFYDYVRLGLPVEIIVIIIAVPLLVIMWPL